MSKLLKIGLPLLLIFSLAAYKFTQPKGELNIYRATTELTINASSLYAAFETDEASANGTYAGKVIEVSGAVASITKEDDGHYVMGLAADSPLGKVLCNLAPGEPEPVGTVAIGNSVTVKGVCTGYLFDVVVDNATLLAK